MARPEGFEPPTTWFEAKYSIQLSYRRVTLSNCLCQVEPSGSKPADLKPQAIYPAELQARNSFKFRLAIIKDAVWIFDKDLKLIE